MVEYDEESKSPTEEDVTNHTDLEQYDADTEPSMLDELREQAWFSWAVRIAALIVIVLIIVFGGRWLHHKLEHKQPAVTTTTTSNSSKITSRSSSEKGASSTKSSASSKKSGSTHSASSSTSTNSQLSNTGPGDVVAIFLAATFAAASLHYVVQNRR